MAQQFYPNQNFAQNQDPYDRKGVGPVTQSIYPLLLKITGYLVMGVGFLALIYLIVMLGLNVIHSVDDVVRSFRTPSFNMHKLSGFELAMILLAFLGLLKIWLRKK
jgi:MFS superfamily sulfate permease-like transporter